MLTLGRSNRIDLHQTRPRRPGLLIQINACPADELGAVLRDDLPDADTGSREVRDFKDMAPQRRITDHTYGNCLGCGKAIDLRRLTALPDTPYCTACQAGKEHERLPSARH